MIAHKRIGILGIAMAVCMLSVGTGHSESIRTLAFADVISLVTKQNLALKQSQQQVALSEVDVLVAGAATQPNLNVSLSPTQNFNRVLNQVSDQVENEQSASVRASLSSNMTLYDGGGNRAAYQATRRDLHATQSALKDTREQVVYSAAAQFLQVSQDVELIRVAEENLASQRAQLKRIEAFFAEGIRSRADVLQQQAIVAQAELQVLNAERNWTVDQLQLKQTLALDPTEAIAVLPLETWDIADDAIWPTGEPFALRADVAAQTQQLEAAAWRIREAKASLMPTLQLSGVLGTDYSSSNDLSSLQSQLFDTNPSLAVGVTLSLPIFDRSLSQSNIARAQVQLAKEELAMSQLEQTVAFEVELARADYRSAAKQREVRVASEAAASEALAAMEARYDTGAATLVELSQARATYVDAASGLVEARYEVVVRYLDMARKLGRIEYAVDALNGGV